MFLFLLAAAAVLANGSTFWLKRTGLLEPEISQQYLSGLERLRQGYTAGSPDPEAAHERYIALKEETSDRLYAVSGTQKLLKLFKDGTIALFLVAGLALTIACRVRPPPLYDPAVLALTGLICIMGAISALTLSPLLALAGLRSFGFLLVMLVGGWFATTPQLALFSRLLTLTVLLQVVLAPIELARGLDIFTGGSPLGDRLTGTMLNPSTLGIYAVITWSFFAANTSSTAQRRGLLAAAALLAWLSGSAMAIALLGIALLIEFGSILRRLTPWKAAVFLLAAAALFFLLLPGMTRWNVMESLQGRLEGYAIYFGAEISPLQWLFGQGLGAGTNTAVNLASLILPPGADTEHSPIVFIADSTPLMLTAQIGLAGCLLFYLVLARAAWSDSRYRTVYLLVATASLTTNIIELFPVNLVLGLLLAHSYGIPAGRGEESAAMRPDKRIAINAEGESG